MHDPFRMKICLQTLRLFLLFTALFPCALAQQIISVSWIPKDLASGSPSLFHVEASKATSITGKWQGHTLNFFKSSSNPDAWYSLAGIDVAAKPGSYELIVEIIRDGATQTLRRAIDVAPAPYKEIPLTVPEKFVQPDPEAQKIIAADQIIKNKVFADTASTPLWTGRFSPPLRSAPRTDSFGTRRVFNGSLASIHRGLDYRAKSGTPVMAINAGRVVLARPLYFEGNCVIIDHGLGLTTLYMHLSKFNVKEGEQIKRGQLIALSGGTGRVTGPHLHLSVRWQGDYLDPAKLFLINLPTLNRPE